VFGLSATPVRFSNNDILKYHLGEVTYFEPEDGELLKPIVYICYFPFGIYRRYEKYIMWGGTFQYSKYEKQMIKSSTYLNVVSELIRSARVKDNRTILVMGKRVDILLKFADMSKIDKDDIGIFIASATDEERLKYSNTCDLREAFQEKKCIFATYGMARDGNNRKDLDCIIMTIPTGNITQAIGRVCRSLEGKRQPIVLDLVDTEGPLENSIHMNNDGTYNKVGLFIKSLEKRIELYKELGYEYKFVNIEKKLVQNME
jgi:superfamily II DNA or RNA helicase